MAASDKDTTDAQTIGECDKRHRGLSSPVVTLSLLVLLVGIMSLDALSIRQAISASNNATEEASVARQEANVATKEASVARQEANDARQASRDVKADFLIHTARQEEIAKRWEQRALQRDELMESKFKTVRDLINEVKHTTARVEEQMMRSRDSSP